MNRAGDGERAIAFSDYSVVPELGDTGGGNWPQTDTDRHGRVF
jgi:hypothetical protein